MIAQGAGPGMMRRSSVYKLATNAKPTVSFVGRLPSIAIESEIILPSQVEVEVTSPQTMPAEGPRSPTTEALVNSLERNIKKRARMKVTRSLDRATFWSICRASIFGGLLFGLGFTMSILGFYKEFFARIKKAKPLEVNVKIEHRLDYSVLSQFEILSYAGPCVMAVGAFVLMLSCVAVLEHRDRRHTLQRTLKPLKNVLEIAGDPMNVLRSSSLKRLDFTADMETTRLTITPKPSIHTVKPKISITSDVGVENVTFLSDSNNDEMNNNVENFPEEEQECQSTVCQTIDPTILNTFLPDVEDRTCGGSFLKHTNSDHLLDENVVRSSNVHYLSPEPYEMSEISQPMIRRRVSLTKSDPEKLIHSHQNGVVQREQDREYCAEDSGRKRSSLSLEPVVIINNRSVK